MIDKMCSSTCTPYHTDFFSSTRVIQGDEGQTKNLRPALRSMHAYPGWDWNLEDLASAAAMSRTAFSVKFKGAAGTSPLNYLTQWRMMLTQERLRADEQPIRSWIEEISYASESAFSHAFKRVVGVSPNQYRQRSKNLCSSSLTMPFDENDR